MSSSFPRRFFARPIDALSRLLVQAIDTAVYRLTAAMSKSPLAISELRKLADVSLNLVLAH